MKMSPQEFLRRKIFRLQPSHDIGFFDFPLEPPHTLVHNDEFLPIFYHPPKISFWLKGYLLADLVQNFFLGGVYKPCGQNFG